MKTAIINKTFRICVLILFSSQFSFAQRNPILDNFSVFENNGKVFLNWTIKSGSTCRGIQIFRSSDNINFKQIGEIIGVCGSISEPITFNFNDEHPEINSFNSYRLELGGNGTSEVLSLEIIDIANGGYQIRPNPVSTIAKIYFNNNKKEPHQFVLYNLKGISVTTLSSNEDFFDFNANNLSSGLYFFSISNANNLEKAKGKMIIQR